eukprot:TRINITY_DN57042_c1_g1_i1.p1 TRINITY_DN57042_c1_g1~~TRINITY_DN57042_c1_g1_i1.p1  ORF type:complete len:367 (-),score=82.71 TRINITY_DN57042_c1_g1_i1:2148-3248(-)
MLKKTSGMSGSSSEDGEGGPEIFNQVSVSDFLRRYEVGDTVGVGGFAVVKQGRDKISNQQVAIKVVDKSRYASGDNSLQREIEVLAKVNHPNCIKLYAVYITSRKVYIVTELVHGGELLDRVQEKGNYSEQHAASLISQILEGVQYLHSRGIVHRDLKLENMIMLDKRDDSPVKIADFGLSKFFSPDTILSTVCGSPQYVAPEVLGVAEGAKNYSPAVDMWSVGVILFILLSGYSPFDDENDAVLFQKIKSGDYDADDPIWDEVSDSAKDLVSKLLNIDSEERLTSEEALQHPWMVSMRKKLEEKNSKMNGNQSEEFASTLKENLNKQIQARESLREMYKDDLQQVTTAADEELNEKHAEANNKKQ